MAIKQDVFPVGEVANVLDKALDKALADLHRLGELIERNEWEILRLKVRSVGVVLSAFSADGVLFVSEGGRILYADQKIEKMFGYGAEELNQHMVDLLITLGEPGPEGQNRESTAQVTERLIRSALDLGERGIRKDGSLFKIGLGVHPGRVEGERVFCLICAPLE
jgi:PAS domain S-box-containing protein